MGTRIHKLLNSVLPSRVRTALREMAIATIPSMRHLDMPFRLRTLARDGFAPTVIYDIGAARGEWSRMAARIWPHAHIFAFEPNSRERAALEHTKADLKAFDYRLCFLGPARRVVSYSDAGTQTSVLAGEGDSTAEMVVLDELLGRGDIPLPQFMKLDVQGFELEVLRGGLAALRSCEAVLLEVTSIPFLPNMPLVGDVVEFMSEQGFVWFDILSALRRSEDDALYQMDVLFIPRHRLIERAHIPELSSR